MKNQDLTKITISNRYFFLGLAEFNPDFYDVVKALDFAHKYHNGKRKDNSPEISHQMGMLSFYRSIYKLLINPVATAVTIILHDVYEDYPESESELLEMFPKYFSYIKKISKIRNGKKISYEQYFGEMEQCPVCSVAKAIDRISNIYTMLPVFKVEKQDKYMEEVFTYFLPMIKKARRLFPEQEGVYELLKFTLTMQTSLIKETRIHS